MDQKEVLEKIRQAARRGDILLSLSDNQLTSLPPEIWQLTNLVTLDLSDNQLTSLPPEIWQLTNLKQLYLYVNALTSLPPEIARLTNLERLFLWENQLTSLPPEIARLTNLKALDLSDNPLISPPPEIVAQGTEAVLAYLRAQLESSQRQWVSKMLVVGQGGVGKTSLLRALRGEPFQEQQETTHGIEVRTLEMAHPTEPNVTMQLNTWDFAGQEIQHATHQFFLTNRSLFLMAWNARHGFQQGRLYYWLDAIKALAPDSPVLLVATWTDERDADLPLSDLRRSYPQIIGHCTISNKTGAGVEELREAIRQAAGSLPLMGEPWPTEWLNAANAMRALPDTEKHVSTWEFRQRLAEHGVTGEDAKVLTQWLHELGDILHFRDNEELNDTVILKPQWVTQYIARVLESENVIQEKGLFTHAEMERLWSDLDPMIQQRFLRLMEQFDLSYRTLENKEISLVVERLPQDEADYHAEWDAMQAADSCHEISMKFELSTIPAGIPTWFIARQHRFTTHTHWRYGVLFASDETETHLALTRAFPHERYLRLTARGPHPQNFFALLKDGIELTLSRFPGLQVTRMVPCPGHNGNPCSYEFNYEYLLKVANKKPTVECQKTGEDVPVAKLLYGLAWDTQDIIVHGFNDINRRIDDQTALMQREFLKLFEREQSLIESHCPNVFILHAQQTNTWRRWFVGEKLELQLLCHYPGDWHPLPDSGIYTIDDPAKWLRDMAPYVQRLVKVLQFVAPFASPLLGLRFSEEDAKAFADRLKLMEQLVKTLPDIETKHPEADSARGIGMHEGRQHAEGADLRALRRLLDLKDPQHQWGGLKKVLTPEGHYLWLCEHHATEYKR